MKKKHDIFQIIYLQNRMNIDPLFIIPNDVEFVDTAYAKYNTNKQKKRYYFILDPNTLTNLSTFIYAKSPLSALKQFMNNPEKYLDHMGKINEVKKWKTQGETLIYVNNREVKKISIYLYHKDTTIPIGVVPYDNTTTKEIFFSTIQKIIESFYVEFSQDFIEYDSDNSIDSGGENE